MPIRAFTLVRILAVAGALSLGACRDNQSELAKLDNQIIGNDADPALTSALEDQIMVDPALTQQSNRNAVRPPETPTQAQYPAPVEGQPAASPVQTASAAAGTGAACSLKGPFDYNPGWANRLPAALPVYPGARVTEAAGYDRADCRVRVVTFGAQADWQRVLDWYNTQAVRAGYASEHQLRGADHVLAGARDKDGAVFYLS